MKSAPSLFDDAWRIGRAAQFLGRTRSWLYKNHGDQGERVPSHKFGHGLVFFPSELRDWRARRLELLPPSPAEETPSPSRFQLAKERIRNRSLTRPDTENRFSESPILMRGA